jgi:hypothetical protein
MHVTTIRDAPIRTKKLPEDVTHINRRSDSSETNAFQGQVVKCLRCTLSPHPSTSTTCKVLDMTLRFNKPHKLTTVVYLAKLLLIMIM